MLVRNEAERIAGLAFGRQQVFRAEQSLASAAVLQLAMGGLGGPWLIEEAACWFVAAPTIAASFFRVVCGPDATTPSVLIAAGFADIQWAVSNATNVFRPGHLFPFVRSRLAVEVSNLSGAVALLHVSVTFRESMAPELAADPRGGSLVFP